MEAIDAVQGTSPRLQSVALEDLHIAFELQDGRNLQVVGGVNLIVPEAEFVALVGPSGCGKSTILRAVAGLIAPVRGRVIVHGVEVRDPPPQVGFMFQRDTLLPWLTVGANIQVGLELGRISRPTWPDRLQTLLEVLRLEGFAEQYPSQLSGGMRQRVSLGRMLAYAPSLMLMDEPFGALDAQTKLALGRELLRIWEAERRSVIFVTHDIEEAVALADRVIVTSSRPARIIADHRIDLPRPRHIRQLRSNTQFTETCQEIWAQLES
jgi:NitT/TauT family transport system ATP-binding protein